MSRAAQARLTPGKRTKRRLRPLTDDPDRYAITLFVMLRDDGVRALQAARTAMILTGPFRWSRLERVGADWFTFSATHKLEAIDLHNRAECLIAKADRLVNRLKDTHLHSAKAAHDLAWLTGSKEDLRIVFDPHLARDPEQGKAAFQRLEQLGWRDQLIAIRDRILSAQHTNFPPASEPVPWLARKAMDATQNKSEKPDEE